ncbi:MAG TPA: ABC transporter substrate-binding protein [Gaiellaceae bacterium]|jgi:peptide/nickel transport system substrate-binding protein|nr:ABC transporter substrate-binding protein [Gaiellaceae bacterium]
MATDKPSERTPLEREITRRDLLKSAGRVGAGIVAAGALAGQAGAAEKLIRRTTKSVPTGGTVTWALEQDPGFLAPFGGILTANRWANEMMYESLLEWDPKLNLKNAIASDYEVVNSKRIVWTIRPGIKFSNGDPVTAADVVYSFNLQANPPLPGSTAVLGQFPYIAGTKAIGKNKVQMDLSKPDARVYGYLAWQRYSAVVPNNMYSTLNPTTQGIGTGPYMLNGSYVPNDHINYVKNPHYWKPGLPYMDGVNYQIVTDEQTRIAALLSGSIDGATISQPNAANLIGNPKVTVLHNLTAAFRELQFTIKPGQNKPWADIRVRQAVSAAINRANIITKVYGGFGQDSGHVAAGYGPWPFTTDQLQSNYEKYDLPTAKSLMKAAGFGSGFSVTMTTFATPTDFAAVAALMANDLQQIGINVNIVTQDSATFAAANGVGSFDWNLTSRGMRGDVDGYVAEYHPSSTAYQAWFKGYPGNTQMFRLIGNGRIQLNTAKRLPMYHQLNQVLMTQMLEVPLVAVSKWQVVSPRLKNMYVAFTDFNTGLRNAYVKS